MRIRELHDFPFATVNQIIIGIELFKFLNFDVNLFCSNLYKSNVLFFTFYSINLNWDFEAIFWKSFSEKKCKVCINMKILLTRNETTIRKFFYAIFLILNQNNLTRKKLASLTKQNVHCNTLTLPPRYFGFFVIFTDKLNVLVQHCPLHLNKFQTRNAVK